MSQIRGVRARNAHRSYLRVKQGTDVLEGDELRSRDLERFLVDEVAHDMELGHSVGLLVYVRLSTPSARLGTPEFLSPGGAPHLADFLSQHDDRCGRPREVTINAPGPKHYRISPHWVVKAQGTGKDYYCAPFPEFIAGLRTESVEQAKSEGKVLLLKEPEAHRVLSGTLTVQYLFVRIVDQEADDLVGVLPRAP
jgi:hypothetical protein